jgi:hypothetical protein
MDFTKTSLPPADRIFSIHPLILFQTRSLRNLNVPLTELPTSVGIPRYLSFNDSLVTCKIFLTTSLVADLMLDNKPPIS